MKVAVIGSGISGLAAAYYLSRKHQVTLFEKESRLGGHTNTVTVDSSQGPLAIDTGFIVHNDRTYPNLVKLFAELGVETMPSDMSFAVTCRKSGFEYSSRGVNGFFAQRRNLLSGSHYRLLREIFRFNRNATKLLDDPELASMTLGDVIERGHYSPVFTERYLYPMAAAVWSMSTDAIRGFPALTLLRFFDNHGMLGINTHPQWKVIRGGSNSYIAPMSAPYRDRIQLNSEIQSVSRTDAGVTIKSAGHPDSTFDHVVFACHGNQILPMLEAPSDVERDVLSQFKTSRNETVLHTDSTLLPRREKARASWNYLIGMPGQSTCLTYHMNRLQSLTTYQDYCVTLNATWAIDPAKILKKLVYFHPIYNRETIRAQSRWKEISGLNRTHYCGAYWFYGFHEDGLNSALRVARALEVDC